jgi:hypothetical protein
MSEQRTPSGEASPEVVRFDLDDRTVTFRYTSEAGVRAAVTGERAARGVDRVIAAAKAVVAGPQPPYLSHIAETYRLMFELDEALRALPFPSPAKEDSSCESFFA